MLATELFKIAVPLGFVLGMAFGVYQSIAKWAAASNQARKIESERPKFERVEKDGKS